MKVHTDPLVDDYLRRLDVAAPVLPAHQRAVLALVLGWIGIVILAAGAILIAFHPNKPR